MKNNYTHKMVKYVSFFKFYITISFFNSVFQRLVGNHAILRFYFNLTITKNTQLLVSIKMAVLRKGGKFGGSWL